ncbi:peptidoglycan DD-metalloendopeptidase family protein [candidate division WOR-3 bacterium]|nr:peptidoglycan DD-metalloendopeptidase family protein [candidate division WOR-3 bacterium]
MEKKYFTIQIFSSDGLTAITKRVSKKILVSVLSLFIIVVLCILTLIAFYGRVYVKAMKVRNLEERNKYLETEFKKIEILSKDIAEIAKQREKLEVALGIKNKKGKEEIKRPEEIKKDDIKVDKHDEVTFTNPEMEKYLEKSKKKSRSIPNLIPVNGWITKGFGTVHRGVDIAAPVGTPILSSIDGNVSFTGWDSILGNVIKVEGVSEFTTIYGHCSSIYVKKGDFVRKGEIIASVGKTGRAEVPHLHYEIEVSGVSVNPELFFKIY